MSQHTYTYYGRTLHVSVDTSQWIAWFENDPRSMTVGAPLEDVLMEIMHLNPVQDETPPRIAQFAQNVREDVLRSGWPTGPSLP